MELTKSSYIKNRIFIFRSSPVMVDRDLAEMYQVETKLFNQALKRNINRFPQIFRFVLSEQEKQELVTNCDWFEKLKHSSSAPSAPIQKDVAMLSNGLNHVNGYENN